MNTKAAKQLSLPELLAQLGYRPTKVSGKKLWYCSPLHYEHTPSFCVEPGHSVNWIFSDYGVNIKGNILDFAMHYQNCSLKEALDWLSKQFVRPYNYLPLPSQSIYSEAKKLQILHLKPIQHLAICDYLNERAISISLAQRYLTEVYYLNNRKCYFALGWPTDKGGWCLRARNFKSSITPTGITTLGLASNQLAIFEGMFDFLSALAFYQKENPRGQVIILNSVVHTSSLIAELSNKNYQYIRLYLDNDTAGRKATDDLMILRNAVDCSSLFSPVKDFALWYETRCKA